MTLEELTKLAKLHLSTLASSVDSAKTIQIKEIKMMDMSLVATFYANSRDTMGTKIEACQIIASLSDLFDGETSFGDFGIVHFGARALDENGLETMNAISTKETARFAREGRAADWLLNTIFIENTEEDRLTRAKTMISRIENGLRGTINTVLNNRYGPNWWNSIDQGIRTGAERTYLNKYGGTALPSGEVLIQYTFLNGLKEIILNDWSDFQSLFGNRNDFDHDLTQLNLVRREEGHNRPITSSHLTILEGIYTKVLSAIEAEFPGIVPQFLIENWRESLSAVLRDLSKELPSISEKDRRKPLIVFEKFKTFRNWVSDLNFKLDGIAPPPSKGKLHSEFKGIVSRSLAALDRMLASQKEGDVRRVENASQDFKTCMDELGEFKVKLLQSEL